MKCTHDCSSCGSHRETCGHEPKNPRDGIMKLPVNKASSIKRVIGVISGKGGVGKSSVASLLAVEAARAGYRTAILDADITGPSIPKIFGIKEKATGTDTALLPLLTDLGIKLMSVNLLLPDETDPVVWRGPVLGTIIHQFWSDVIWGDIDIMFVDMPPGTGDVALTVYQSLPVDGIVIVTSPQALVGMIVEKAVKMARKMDIPILGLVENMAYFLCPHCGNRYELFGPARIDETGKKYKIENLLTLPMDPALMEACDQGRIEAYRKDGIGPFLKGLLTAKAKAEGEDRP